MSDKVYKKVELVGCSAVSVEKAVEAAVSKAAGFAARTVLVRGQGDPPDDQGRQALRVAGHARGRFQAGTDRSRVQEFERSSVRMSRCSKPTGTR